jgi:transposase
MARKTYTREFKLQAVRMITEQGLSVSEAARRLGVSQNCLRVWRDAAKQQDKQAFPGHGNRTPEQEELHRLRSEITRLRAERDLLKKAAAYFASHPS